MPILVRPIVSAVRSGFRGALTGCLDRRGAFHLVSLSELGGIETAQRRRLCRDDKMPVVAACTRTGSHHRAESDVHLLGDSLYEQAGLPQPVPSPNRSPALVNPTVLEFFVPGRLANSIPASTRYGMTSRSTSAVAPAIADMPTGADVVRAFRHDAKLMPNSQKSATRPRVARLVIGDLPR